MQSATQGSDSSSVSVAHVLVLVLDPSMQAVWAEQDDHSTQFAHTGVVVVVGHDCVLQSLVSLIGSWHMLGLAWVISSLLLSCCPLPQVLSHDVQLLQSEYTHSSHVPTLQSISPSSLHVQLLQAT